MKDQTNNWIELASRRTDAFDPIFLHAMKGRLLPSTYSPSENTWLNDVGESIKMDPHTLISCASIDTIYLFGGVTAVPESHTNLYIFNTKTSRLDLILPSKDSIIPQSRKNGSLIYSQSILSSTQPHLILFGGLSASNEDLNDTYIFNLTTREWSEPKVFGTIPRERQKHSAILYQKKMIVYGGLSASDTFQDLMSLDLKTMIWSVVEQQGSGAGPRHSHSATYYRNKMVIYGGFTDSETLINNLLMLDLGTIMFNVDSFGWKELSGQLGSNPEARDGHSIAVVRNILYLHGGSTKAGLTKDLWAFPGTFKLTLVGNHSLLANIVIQFEDNSSICISWDSPCQSFSVFKILSRSKFGEAWEEVYCGSLNRCTIEFGAEGKFQFDVEYELQFSASYPATKNNFRSRSQIVNFTYPSPLAEVVEEIVPTNSVSEREGSLAGDSEVSLEDLSDDSLMGEEDEPGPEESTKIVSDEMFGFMRFKSQYRLKSAWERIIEKYSKTFEGLDDEVDIVTGKIIVDRGALERATSTAVGAAGMGDDIKGVEEAWATPAIRAKFEEGNHLLSDIDGKEKDNSLLAELHLEKKAEADDLISYQESEQVVGFDQRICPIDEMFQEETEGYDDENEYRGQVEIWEEPIYSLIDEPIIFCQPLRHISNVRHWEYVDRFEVPRRKRICYPNEEYYPQYEGEMYERSGKDEYEDNGAEEAAPEWFNKRQIQVPEVLSSEDDLIQ